MDGSKSKNPLKSISLVMLLTLIGKLSGLLRDRLLTVNYGSGTVASAFLTASRIPRVFFDAIFASAIAASFIPVFNEIAEKKTKREALSFSSDFMAVIGGVSLILTILGIVFANPLVKLFADGYDTETALLCASLTRIMFPTVLFTAVAYTFVGILQSFDEFNLPALISVVSNAIVIVYYFTLNDRFGVFGLSVAFLIGWLAQAVIQWPSVRKKGFRFRLKFDLRSEGMKKVFTLMLPVILSTWVQPINTTVNSKFASRLFNGSGVAAVELSSNLYYIIIGVFVLSVTNVIFPKLSKLRASDAESEFGDTVRSTVHSTLYIVAPMTAGLIVLAHPLIGFIYGGGEFDAQSIDITSRALVWFATGMPGYAVQIVLCRVYFAEQNGRIPLISGGASIVVNIILCMLLLKPLDVAGLAIASSAAITVNAIILAFPLHRKGIRVFDRELTVSTLKAAAASVIMGFVVLFLRNSVSSHGDIVALCVPAAAGVLSYFVLTVIFRCGEAQLVVSAVKRRLSR